MNLSLARRPEPQDGVFDDGSMIVTVQQLQAFGFGDAKRGRRELRLMLNTARENVSPKPKPHQVPGVRLAQMEDEPVLIALVMRGLEEEGATKVAPIDRERVAELVRRGTRQKGALIGVVGKIGVPVGFVIMDVEQWWWSSAFSVQQRLTYVHPDYRQGADHFNNLVEWARWATEYWSMKFGYRIFAILSVLGLHKVPQKIILYRRRFHQAGAIFAHPDPFDRGSD